MGIFSYLLCCGTNQDIDVYNDIYEETSYFGRKRTRNEKERRAKKEPEKMFWRRMGECFNVFRRKQAKYSLENLIESRRVLIIAVDIFEIKTEEDFFDIEVKVEENLTIVDKLQNVMSTTEMPKSLNPDWVQSEIMDLMKILLEDDDLTAPKSEGPSGNEAVVSAELCCSTL
ncbi:hypothetical protein SRHO_G00238150 [Serrasalmus rhombeus]